MELGMENCPMGMAYCGASSKEDQGKVQEILSKYGKKEFNKHWLAYKKLPEHLELYESVFRIADYTTGAHSGK